MIDGFQYVESRVAGSQSQMLLEGGGGEYCGEVTNCPETGFPTF